MDARHIVFRLGEETGHIIEGIDDTTIKASVFSDQYKKGLYSLETLLERRAINVDEEDNVYNNIISFIGDRGSGKTSCMLSFANLLTSGLSDELKDAYPRVSSTAFYQLKRIDPSFFDKQHNVIELFLATMYNDFVAQRMKIGNNADKERKVVACFAEAQKMMAEMTKPQDDGFDVLEKLRNLSAGIILGSAINELVRAYMEYLGLHKGVLVVPIDDIDLNNSLAAEMMEQIRKYLILPNVLILLAVKLDQMGLAKHLQLREEYAKLCESTVVDDDVLEEMTDAYLTKLLPHQQRIYMPDGAAYFNRPVDVIYEDNRDEYSSVRQMVPELIFKKTRYLFYNSPDKTSYIVPDNLRELRFLVSMLYGMEDYWVEPREKAYRESNRYNKLLFRKYLYENWAPNNLSNEMQRNVRWIVRIQEPEQVNAAVVACLKQVFSDLQDVGLRTGSRLAAEWGLITNPLNVRYNIAAGDVLDIIDSLEDTETDVHKLRFLFLLRSFYSMRLYQAYDMVTEEDSIHEDSVVAPSKLSDLDLSDYDKQVAGFPINTRITKLVPRGRAIRDTRDERPIAFSEVLRLIHEVTEEGGGNVLKLQLVEFFMLGISRRIDTKDDYRDTRYRQSNAVFYAEPLDNLTKNAYFDVGALLYNLSRIKKCYERFKQGEEIYRLAEANEGSLLNVLRLASIKEKAREDEPKDLAHFHESYWLSWCCFRNAEIIRAFKDHVSLFKNPGGSEVSILAESFKHMADFSIPSYDKVIINNREEYYRITFKYLNVFGELLNRPEIQDDFRKVFIREERPLPEIINISIITKNSMFDRNKKSTRLNILFSSYPVISQYYRDEVLDVFDDYGDYMTRKEIEQAAKRVSIQLDHFRAEE